MPDIITHYLFGEDVLNSLEDSPFKASLKDHLSLFYIGCQGPDPFFYHHYAPFKRHSQSWLGHHMHSTKTGDFFKASLNYLKNLDASSDEFNQLASFIAGLVCHYALDKTAHPYIFHVTGEYDKSQSETYPYRGNHKRLEMVIDTLLLNQKHNLDSKTFKVHETILSLPEIPDSLQHFMDAVLYDVYHVQDAGVLYNGAYQDCKAFWRFAYDPLGFKKKIFKFVDHLFNKTGSIVYETLSYYDCVDPKIDYLNEQHRLWCHPCYKDEIFDDSFHDLMLIGLEDALQLIHIMTYFIDDSDDTIHVTALDNVFKNLSYSTGKVCDDPSPIQHFNSIF